MLSVQKESQLLEISHKLNTRGIQHKLIREPEAPWDNQATAIGIQPVEDREEVRRILSNLPLLK